jgi:hypothetical protein
MELKNNCLKYFAVLPSVILLWAACQSKNYRVDKRSAATLTFYTFRIYQDERLQILVNGKDVLSDTVNAKKDRYYYLRYLNPDMPKGTSVTLRSHYKDSVLIDTSFKIADSEGRYFLSVSAPYPANISPDSLKRIKVPYKFGPLSIKEGRRTVTFEPDTAQIVEY